MSIKSGESKDEKKKKTVKETEGKITVDNKREIKRELRSNKEKNK